MQFWICLFSSFFLVAFGQPAWVPAAGLLAAAGGYALFWKAMLYFPNRGKRFLLAAVWFAAVHSIQLSWMTSTHYMGPLILGVYAFLLLGLGIQFGLFSCLLNGQIGAANPLKVCGKKLAAQYLIGESLLPYLQAAAFAGGFVFLEWMRLYFLTGFTWNPAGLALVGNRYSIQLAALLGVYGLTFWVILTNFGALVFFLKPTKTGVAAWAFLALFPYGFGLVNEALVKSRSISEKRFTAAVIETGLLVEQKNRDRRKPENYIPPVNQWERVWSFLEDDEPVQLIVLPEAAFARGFDEPYCSLEVLEVRWRQHFGASGGSDFPPLEPPFAFPFERKGKEGWMVTNAFFAQALANHFKADLIVGFDRDDGPRRTNAAFLFRPKGLSPEIYDKRVLVPVGEYIPLQHIGWVSDFLSRNFGIDEAFEAGSEAKVFQAHIPIGVAICLEEIYSGLVWDLRKKGAELLVSLSNDVWFPDSRLAQQHYDHGRIRAVENGLFLLRSSNMGLTGGIDCFGQPIGILSNPGKSGAVYLSVPIFSHRTLFSLWGNGAILLVSGLSMILFAIMRRLQNSTVAKKR